MTDTPILDENINNNHSWFSEKKEFLVKKLIEADV